RDHAIERQVVVAKRDIQLIENDQVEALIGHQLLRLAPSALRRGDVAAEILRLPGEALAHGVPGDLIAELGQRVALGRMPGALDELHHADPLAAAEHAQREAERRRGFPLAGAGVHDQQALLDGLARHLLILPRLAVRHLGAMALGLLVVDRFAHGLFTATGRPATIMVTRTARAASPWLRLPWRSRTLRASALSGTMPRPTSLETTTVGPVLSASACSHTALCASISA